MQEGSPDDMVLVRVYGNSTERFIDRAAEIKVAILYLGLFPDWHLLGRFWGRF